VDKTKAQQFESTGFQDPQAAAEETSSNEHYSVGGEGRSKELGVGEEKELLKIIILSFLAGKYFLPRA
jgi:hypothetical protein